MLTQKQRDLLILIHKRLANGEVAPSFDEMRESLGLKSKSGIHRLISALEERGFLQRLPNKARALHVLKLPEGYVPQDDDMTDVAQAIRQGRKDSTGGHNVQPLRAESDSVVHVPLCGKIAAGTPIEAIAHEGLDIGLPAGMVGRGGHYALGVGGGSRLGAGLYDQGSCPV